VDLLGFGVALVAAACYGVYTVSAKRMLADHPPLAVIATTLGVGALLLAATVGTLALAEPLVAVMLGLLVVGERLSFTVSAGAVLLFASLVLVATARGVQAV